MIVIGTCSRRCNLNSRLVRRPKKKAETMKHLLIAILFAVAAGSGTAQTDDTPRAVKVTEIRADNLGISRQFFGRVVARQTVDLAFQVSGQVKAFPVLEGEVISEGALVAQLDLEPFMLQYNQARVQLSHARRTLERLQRLSGSTVSQVTIDDATTEVELAELVVRNAEYSLEHATLHAPFDSLVATRSVANFTTVGAGTPVVRLHDMSELRIEIDVPEILFQRAGQNPDVRLTASFPGSDEIFPLEIREYDAQASSVGQTFQLTLAMPRPEGLAIIPGSSVTVEATLRDEVTSPELPASAILIGNDGATLCHGICPDGRTRRA